MKLFGLEMKLDEIPFLVTSLMKRLFFYVFGPFFPGLGGGGPAKNIYF